MKEPSQESISAYFDGVCKNAYLIYRANEGGFDMANETALEKFNLLTERFFKDIHEVFLTDITRADSMEISFELTSNKVAEKLLAEFWILTGIVNPSKTEVVTHGKRDYFLRPLADEVIMSYFMGLSWIMKDTYPNREEKLMSFYKYVKKKMGLDIESERIYELDEFYISEKITEWRLRAVDTLQIRHTIRKSA